MDLINAEILDYSKISRLKLELELIDLIIFQRNNAN